MLKKIKKIDAKIAQLYNKKKEIQENCEHPEIFYKYVGSTGNYDPSDDGYTFEYRCKCCDYWGFIEDKDEAYRFRSYRKATYKEDR